MAGQIPDRGQPAAGSRGEVADGRHGGELSPELVEQGDSALGVQAEDQASCPSGLV